MTIKEAVERKIKRVRLSIWEPNAYVELPLFDNGKVGAAATVHDSSGEVLVGMWELDGDEWEPFDRPSTLK